jgi:3-oxoacyl-[acyl-carrier protein] reductase
MYRQKTGKIIFISSVAAQAPQAGQAAYAAAKGALESFTRALSQEVSQRGIMVNCIAPGLTDTPMGAIHIAKAKEQGRTVQVHLPEEVARIIKFLCSAEASEVSGKTLTV